MTVAGPPPAGNTAQGSTPEERTPPGRAARAGGRAAQGGTARDPAPRGAAGPEAGSWGAGMEALRGADPRIAEVVLAELARQRRRIQLVAGENLTSPAVLTVLGSPLANKYAEGYPGRRHHGGCEVVDVAEQLAVERAKQLFGVAHANVQPYSGSSANLAAYAALLVPGDTVLAMSLEHGGHLTHGSSANFSGRWFRFHGYGVRRDTGEVDYDQVRDLALARRPKAIVCGSIAHPRHLDYAAFRAIADEVDAYLIVDAAHTIGLVAGGVAPSPVPWADVVCATTHKVLRGPRGGLILCGQALARRIDRAVFPFSQGGPHMNSVAAKAVAFAEAATPEYAAYTRQVVRNARALARGLAEEGVEPLTGGTDTHLVTASTLGLGLDGLEARSRCARAGIVLDKSCLPYDERPVEAGSGVRAGTSSVTTQGMGEEQLAGTARLIARALRDPDGRHRAELTSAVAALLEGFPAYPAG
ncbi:serine hydroxymethyltransferase [Streptomyces capparidis]